MNFVSDKTEISVSVSTKAPGAAFQLTATESGTDMTYVITMPSAGYYHFKMFLTNTATTPNKQATGTLPTGGTTTEWHETTASDGTLTKVITNVGAGTWVIWAVFLGVAAPKTLTFTT